MAATHAMIALLARVLRSPRALGALMGAAWRFRARSWWRRPPFLPLPPRSYLEWRLHTAYGDGGRAPTADELSRFLGWANRMHRSRRAGGEGS